MTEAALNYVYKICRLKIPNTVVLQTKDILDCVPALSQQLADQTGDITKKHMVIDKVFPMAMRDILKLLCDNGDMGLLSDIFDAYEKLDEIADGKLHANLLCVTPPDDKQYIKIRDFLIKKYGRDDVVLKVKIDPSISGGFKIMVGDEVIDWTAEGRTEQLKEQLSEPNANLSTENIISILKAKVEEFDLEVKHKEIGTVKSIGDGIAVIDGLDHACYGEVIIFDSGVKGMVQDIRRKEIGCILFGSDDDVSEGSHVVRTGKTAGIPVGEGFLSRVVDSLGNPIDGRGQIQSDGYYPIESQAPGIVDRESVSVPMDTGILAIDSMFPIGRGQRELIIGDRQTGKTAIALDTILNQKGKDVICIYVAIGQKASSVARVVSTMKKHGALDYCVILCANASDPAPLQYIAPYAGCAIAEYFMNKGKDVLIVYDDLSKHAVAYRALSLLLERSPGREAYPGDVFYLHSRLLERSARLTKEKGGGSITALPIIETQAGDVSAYIPTNVISITDGQIFLESDLFFSGQRPAVNVGLSVSRVGGAAQSKAMKKAAGSIRLELAQYREMEVFTQFSSDLDDTTKEQLQYGASLMELLKQPQYRSMSLHEQVITLVVAENMVMLKIPIKRINDFQEAMLTWFESEHKEICTEIEESKTLSSDLHNRIVTAAREFHDAQAGQFV